MSAQWKGGTGRGRGWTDEEEVLLEELDAENVSPTLIAKKLGVKPQRVTDKLKALRGEGRAPISSILPPRNCLGFCGNKFTPESRGLFMCPKCRRAA